MAHLLENKRQNLDEPSRSVDTLLVITEISRVVPSLFTKHPEGDMLRYKAANLLLDHPQVIRYWDTGGITGEENKQFHNVMDHQVLVGLFADTTAQLIGLPTDARRYVTHHALIHDWDVIREKCGAARTHSKERDGYEFYDQDCIDTEQFFQAERSKTGIARATGCDFTDFDTWGVMEYLLRAGDNSADMPKGYQDLVDPHTVRFPTLRAKKDELHKKGIPLYGMGTWDKLEEITEIIEYHLHRAIVENNPHLAGYPHPHDLYQLIRDTIWNGLNPISHCTPLDHTQYSISPVSSGKSTELF